MTKQAIILCAGQGKRLRPLTNNTSKCLIRVNGVSLLENALKQLEANGIEQVVLVTGYLHDQIKEWVDDYKTKMKIILIFNEKYDSANNIYSLFCAEKYLNTDTLLLECDLFYSKKVIGLMLATKNENCMALDIFDTKTMDGTVVRCDGNKVTEMILSRFQKNDFDYRKTYKTVNIYKFNKKFLEEKFVPYLKLYIETQSLDNYYEIILAIFINFYKINISMVFMGEVNWIEIDNYQDLHRAEILFTSKGK